MPSLSHDYFAQTIILICEHGTNGAMGLIVNRPTDISLRVFFAELNIKLDLLVDEAYVFEGGPVSQHQGFIVHSQDTNFPDPDLIISPTLALSTSTDMLNSIADGKPPANFLVALGCASWGAGQLEQELKDHAWLTVPAQSSILFETPAEERLLAAGGLLGFDFRLISKPGNA
jgi:putative transcriptional regulator